MSYHGSEIDREIARIVATWREALAWWTLSGFLAGFLFATVLWWLTA